MSLIDGLSKGIREVLRMLMVRPELFSAVSVFGMIMCTKGLLDRNPDPTEEEIKYALRNNYCRCTGYVNYCRSKSWQRSCVR